MYMYFLFIWKSKKKNIKTRLESNREEPTYPTYPTCNITHHFQCSMLVCCWSLFIARSWLLVARCILYIVHCTPYTQHESCESGLPARILAIFRYYDLHSRFFLYILLSPPFLSLSVSQSFSLSVIRISFDLLLLKLCLFEDFRWLDEKSVSLDCCHSSARDWAAASRARRAFPKK